MKKEFGLELDRGGNYTASLVGAILFFGVTIFLLFMKLFLIALGSFAVTISWVLLTFRAKRGKLDKFQICWEFSRRILWLIIGLGLGVLAILLFIDGSLGLGIFTLIIGSVLTYGAIGKLRDIYSGS